MAKTTKKTTSTNNRKTARTISTSESVAQTAGGSPATANAKSKTTVKKKAVVKKAPTTKKAAAKKTATKKTTKTSKKKTTKKKVAQRKPADRIAPAPISASQRHALIAEAAYLHAEAHGFCTDPHADWARAESEVDERLARQGIMVTN